MTKYPVILYSDGNENSLGLHPLLSSYCLKNKTAFFLKVLDRDFKKEDLESLKIESYPIISYDGICYGYNDFMTCYGNVLSHSPLDLTQKQKPNPSKEQLQECRLKIWEDTFEYCSSCGG